MKNALCKAFRGPFAEAGPHENVGMVRMAVWLVPPLEVRVRASRIFARIRRNSP